MLINLKINLINGLVQTSKYYKRKPRLKPRLPYLAYPFIHSKIQERMIKDIKNNILLLLPYVFTLTDIYHQVKEFFYL